MNGKSNYATASSYEDDGSGQIICPKKGLLAIQRCRQLQRDTAEAGASCLCPTYERYRGGEPDRDIGPTPPHEQRCGREAPLEPKELSAIARGRRSMPVRESIDVEIALITNSNRRPPVQKNEAPPMATHNKDAKRCDLCKQPSPDGTRVINKLCKPCRDKDRDAKSADKRAAAEKRLAEIAAKHRDDAATATPSAESAAKTAAVGNVMVAAIKRELSPGVRTTSEPASDAARQQVLPAVAQQEIDTLKRLVEDRDRDLVALKLELDRVKWIAHGVRAGYEPIERLSDIEKPRGSGRTARS